MWLRQRNTATRCDTRGCEMAEYSRPVQFKMCLPGDVLCHLVPFPIPFCLLSRADPAPEHPDLIIDCYRSPRIGSLSATSV